MNIWLASWIDGASSSGGRCSRFDLDDGRTRQVKVFRWGKIVGKPKASRRFLLILLSVVQTAKPSAQVRKPTALPSSHHLCRFRGGILGCRTGTVGIHSLAQHYEACSPRRGFFRASFRVSRFRLGKRRGPDGECMSRPSFPPNWPFGGRPATTLRDAGGSEAITRQCRD